jgi:opacity protein-like surface antigen
MKKFLVMVSTLCVLGLAANASAQDDRWSSKSFGVGANHAIDGGTALSVRGVINDAFGLEFMLGGDVRSTRNETGVGTTAAAVAKTSTSAFDLTLLADFRVATSQRAVFSVYGGLGLTLGSEAVTTGGAKVSSSSTDIAIELGVRGEAWLQSFFSVHARVGVVIDPISQSKTGTADDTSTKSTGLNLHIFRGDLLGSAGFTFWFM